MEPPIVTIEFEVDPLKNQQLGNITSRIVENEDGVTNLEAGDTDGPGSYLSVQLTTIQTIDGTHTLFVWHTVYHPNVGRRFRSAVLTVKLTETKKTATDPQKLTSALPIRVQQFAPRKSFGGASIESQAIHWGLELPLKIPTGPVEIGVTPSIKKASATEIEHAFVIIGSARGIPQKNTCVWTLEENESTQRGLPSEVRFAALIEHTGPILCEVNATAWVAGGLKLPHHLRTKTPKSARSLEIDPEEYKGKLEEFESIHDVSQCRKFLESWTGQIPGAVLEFQEPILRP